MLQWMSSVVAPNRLANSSVTANHKIEILGVAMDYQDYEYYTDEFYDDDDYYDYDEYYEPYEPPTRWQRLTAWFNRLYWRIRLKLQPNLNQFDDIPF